jgi:membrane protein implicated in regulation of membrane protease activity
MAAWLVWIIIAAGLAAAEAVSLDLVLIMLAGGAAAAALTAGVGLEAPVQVVVAIAVSGGLLAGVRPIARRHLTAPNHVTGAAALVGKHATVLTLVNADGGRVKLNGAEWTARSYDPTQLIAAGSDVTVMEINGATAVVWANL